MYAQINGLVAGRRFKTTNQGKEQVMVVNILQRVGDHVDLIDVSVAGPDFRKFDPVFSFSANGSMPVVDLLCEIRHWNFESKSGVSVRFVDFIGDPVPPKGGGK